jgi:hypothetical protein
MVWMQPAASYSGLHCLSASLVGVAKALAGVMALRHASPDVFNRSRRVSINQPLMENRNGAVLRRRLGSCSSVAIVDCRRIHKGGGSNVRIFRFSLRGENE